MSEVSEAARRLWMAEDEGPEVVYGRESLVTIFEAWNRDKDIVVAEYLRLRPFLKAARDTKAAREGIADPKASLAADIDAIDAAITLVKEATK